MPGKQIFAVIFSIFCLLLKISAAWAAGDAALDISPASLKIGIFFSGSEIDLSGFILSDRDIVIEIIGPDGKGEFNLKAKVGPFWMNREKVRFKRLRFFMPCFCPVKTDRQAGRLLWHRGSESEKAYPSRRMQ